MTTDTVTHKAAQHRRAERELRTAIRQARAAGVPLRAIAAAAGVTHQTIANWTRGGTP